MTAKLKLKNTKQSEAVKELLCMTNGVPYEQRTKLLGGSSIVVGVKEANQVKELLQRFIAS
jgi:hypothetical protein